MTTHSEFVSLVSADHKIDEHDVAEIRARLYADGRLDLDDVKLLVDVYCGVNDYCPAFEDLFFEVLEKVMLADGEIQPSEQYYLLKMLYSDRVVRDREKEFLRTLQSQVKRTSPELEALCREAFQSKTTDWDVGGA